MQIEGQAIHGRAACPQGGAPVLLLHGAAFDSGTWETLGMLAVLAGAGFRAAAIDQPELFHRELVAFARRVSSRGRAPGE